MALVLNDRVKETTTTTGTSTVNLAGAETGFESFVAGIGNSNTTYYAIVHQTADEFEVGLGTVTDATPDTLSRTTIISSSNSDSAVNFSAGTKDVFCTLPASKSVVEDASDNIALGAAPTISNASGNLTLDVAGELILDADSGYWYFNDGGSTIGYVENSSSNLVIRSHVNDKDIIFTGTDNNSGITALTLDMSDAGKAIFNNGITIAANADIRSGGNGTSWTGETDFKIQHYNTKVYLQYAANGLFLRNNSGNDRMELDASGNATFSGNVTAYGTPSDIRLKENIEVIDNALDKVKQLKGITYDLKSDGNRLTGLIAQDLEKVLPEAVYTTNSLGDSVNEESEEHLAIRYGNTVGLLVEAIKELEARVKELEGK